METRQDEPEDAVSREDGGRVTRGRGADRRASLEAAIAGLRSNWRDLDRRDSFAAVSLQAAPRGSILVDATCGSSPHLAVRWRCLGYRGVLAFVDWNPDALGTHRLAYWACLRELRRGKAGAARWLRGNVLASRLDGAWIAIHATLPRWMASPVAVHKPRSVDDGARLLLALARTGACGLSSFLHPVEHEVLVGGASRLGWPADHVPNVQSADWQPFGEGRYLRVRFASTR